MGGDVWYVDGVVRNSISDIWPGRPKLLSHWQQVMLIIQRININLNVMIASVNKRKTKETKAQAARG